MNETKKAVLIVVLSIVTVAALIVWVPDPRGAATPTVWALRFVFSLALLLNLALVIRAFRQRDLVPDFLQYLTSDRFERDGVSFSILPAVIEGVVYLNIAFQNRYLAACEFHVLIEPAGGFFSIDNESPFAGVDVIIRPAAGMLGVIHAPLEVPTNYQGKQVKFIVKANARYIGGKRNMLLSQRGVEVGVAGQSNVLPVAMTVLAFATGHLHLMLHSSARFEMQVPTAIVEVLPDELEPTFETLWIPGDSIENVPGELLRAIQRA
jgi:hypothetical protein